MAFNVSNTDVKVEDLDQWPNYILTQLYFSHYNYNI